MTRILLMAGALLIWAAKWPAMGRFAGHLMRTLVRLSRGRLRARYVYEIEGAPNDFDPRESCTAYSYPPCGGCDACCIAQARYYGVPVHPIPAECTTRRTS